jgi:hyperosmotically inducible periplasmic protein
VQATWSEYGITPSSFHQIDRMRSIVLGCREVVRIICTTQPSSSLLMRMIRLALLAAAALSSHAALACDATQDAWIDGRLSTALLLNPQMNAAGVVLEVRDCVARLYGTVESQIDRDLALRIAEGVEGVVEIRDELEVTMAGMEEERRAADRLAFRRWVVDATTTAVIREKIKENRNITSEEIHVQMADGVVILTGTVPVMTERTMAELLARNVEGVETVRNLLEVAD